MTDSRLKSIDITQPLGKETREWLHNRNQHELLAEYERNMAGESKSEETESQGAPPDPPSPILIDEYEKWNVDQLKAEIDERAKELDEEADEDTRSRLSYTSKDRKDDLIAKLRADDQDLSGE